MNEESKSPAMSENKKKRPLASEKEEEEAISSPSTAKTNDDSSASKREEVNNNNSSCCSPSPKTKRQKKKNVDPDAFELRTTIQQCCATNDLHTAITAYDEAVKKGTMVLAQTFYNLLALCDGLSERGLHIGSPKNTTTTSTTALSSSEEQSAVKEKAEEKDDPNDVKKMSAAPTRVVVLEVSLEERRRHAFRIKAHMDERQIPPTEPAYTSLVKLLCKTDDLVEAEKLLKETQGVQQCRPKLRLYSPLLLAYCERGDVKKAIYVWLLLSQQGLQVTEREYAALIRCATQTANHNLMERVLADLAEDVLVPSRDTCQAVADWFRSAAAAAATVSSTTTATPTPAVASDVNKSSTQEDDDSDDTTTTTNMKDLLKQIRVPQQSFPSPSMGPIYNASSSWTMSDTCSIDTKTGILQSGCLKGERLQPVAISPPELWNQMRQANETIVLQGSLQEHASEFQGGKKGKKQQRKPSDVAEKARHWQHFQDYLAQRTSSRDGNNKRIDVVIDGANVGYHKRSFHGAPKHVSYEQIDWIVEHFMQQKKSVLLIMHSRHFARSMMPRRFEPLLQKWLKAGILYRTPPGMNDDWFWMHAALYGGPPENDNDRTLVLTNDEMRDHHFQMLAQRSFLRWKDRHQVHFSFGDWVDSNNNVQTNDTGGMDPMERRQVVLTYPEPYTRRIQRVADGLVIPLPKRGDENRFLDGSHDAPDDAPEQETYLCIRPCINKEGL